MQLYNALIQYSSFGLAILFIHLTYGQETTHQHAHHHHTHEDTVIVKHSETTTPIDTLHKHLETPNVQFIDDIDIDQKSDTLSSTIEPHSDDEHEHDSVEARLRAKHDLRKFVHGHIQDEKHENEQEYIDQLNAPFESGSRLEPEPQFQYEIPPLSQSESTDTLANEKIQQNRVSDDTASVHKQSATPAKTESIQKQSQQDAVSSVDATANETVKQNQVSGDVPSVQKQPASSTQTQSIKTQSHQDAMPPVDTIAKDIKQQVRTQDNVKVLTPSQNETSPPPVKKQVDQVVSPTGTPVTATKQPIRTQNEDVKLQSQVQQPITNEFSSPEQIKSDQRKPSVDSVVNNTVQNESSAQPTSSNQQETLHTTKPVDILKNDTTQPNRVQDDVPLVSEQSNEKIAKDTARQVRIPNDINPSSATKTKNNEQPHQIVPDMVKPIETVQNDLPNPESIQKEHPTHKHIKPHTPTPSRVLRSATSRMQQATQAHLRHGRHTEEKQQELPKEAETISIGFKTETQQTENLTDIESLPPLIKPTVDASVEQNEQSILPRATHEQPEEPHVNILDSSTQRSPELVVVESETKMRPPLSIDESDQAQEEFDDIDLPRQVHVHDHVTVVDNDKEANLTATPTNTKEDSNKSEKLALDQEVANATVASFLITDSSPHLPRVHESDEIQEEEEEIINLENRSSVGETPANGSESTLPIDSNNETSASQKMTSQVDSKVEEVNNSNISQFVPISPTPIVNNSNKKLTGSQQQVCWRLPTAFESSVELIENQILRVVSMLPEFIQTILFGETDDRETLWNRVWFGSIGTLCALFSFLFLSMGTRRLKQNKHEKEIRSRCQQLQQYNNQIELERATFERQNQKLSDEIDELRNMPARDTDEDLFQSREECARLNGELHLARVNYDALKQDNDYKQSQIQRHEFDMQKQIETVAYLNDELLGLKQELDKTRATLVQFQSNDMSLERLGNLQETIQQHKSELSQLKQEKFAQLDFIQELQERANRSDIENNQLTIKLKQLKDLLEQRDETLARIREKMLADDGETGTTELEDLLSTVTDNSTNSDDQRLLSTVNNDIEKANQHMRDLHTEIEERTRRIKELDTLLSQEKDRCREMETKLKVILELRERDAHLHIRQLGQTDAELRKARTDTDRVRILQQQLELKQQQLDDVQKVLAIEQTKFSDECSKLQHETHGKWMEVKRLTRELEASRKECEGLRRQITKYANSERSSQEKTMLKPVPQHVSAASRGSSEPETNGSSPPPLPYSQGENFRPIDHQRGDSGALSPAEMFRTRPPHFGLPRPPFYPPPHFMPPPPPNPFMMASRFPMPMGGPHGMISPIAHLMTNGGSSDANSFELVDSTNITPNSISFDPQLNGSAISPTPEDEQQQSSAKPKKAKKSTKKKTKTPTTATTTAAASGTKEDV